MNIPENHEYLRKSKNIPENQGLFRKIEEYSRKSMNISENQ
jgi:hypothetical protein